MIALFGSIAILAFLPWLDTSRVRSATYRPLYRQFFWIFVIVCIGLGWLGSKPAEGGYVIASRVLTAWYFLHFIVVLPLLGLVEKPKPLPNSISEAVLKHKKAVASLAVFLAGAALFLGAPAPASAQEHDQPIAAPQCWSFAGLFGRYDPGQLQRGFKIYRASARSVTASTWWRSALSAKRAGPTSREAEVEAIAANTRSRTAPTIRAKCSSAPAGRPTTSRRRSRTSRRRASPTAAPCRPTCRCSPRRASTSAAFPGSCSTSSHPVPGTRPRLHRRPCSRVTRRSPPT